MGANDQEQDHYDVLGVAADANDQVIREAYRWLARKFHPDQNVDGDARADAMMKRVNVAYGVLGDPIERRAYDGRRGGVRPQPEVPQRSHVPPPPGYVQSPPPGYPGYVPPPPPASRIRTCPTCGAVIAVDAPSCPRCSAPPTVPRCPRCSRAIDFCTCSSEPSDAAPIGPPIADSGLRLGRTAYAFLLVVSLLTNFLGGAAGWWGYSGGQVFALLMIPIGVMNVRGRLRDIGEEPGRWWRILIPLYNVYFGLRLLLIRSKVGARSKHSEEQSQGWVMAALFGMVMAGLLAAGTPADLVPDPFGASATRHGTGPAHHDVRATPDPHSTTAGYEISTPEYAITFPAQPGQAIDRAAGTAWLRTIDLTRSANASYSFQVISYPKGAAVSEQREIDGVVARARGDVVADARTAIGTCSGRDVTVATTSSTIRMLLCVTSSRVYIAMTRLSRSARPTEEQEAQIFASSFCVWTASTVTPQPPRPPRQASSPPSMVLPEPTSTSPPSMVFTTPTSQTPEADHAARAPSGEPISQEEIRSEIAQHSHTVREACYDATKLPSLHISVRALISPSGDVTDTTATGDDALVARCVEKQVRYWKWTPARGGEALIPFSFVHQDTDAPLP